MIRSGPKPQTRGWTHSDREKDPTQTGREPTQTGIRHPNQTGPRPHSDRALRIPIESIRTLPPCRFFLAMAWKGMGAGTTQHSPHLSSWDSIERRWKPFIKPGPLPLCDVIERHVGLSMWLNPAPCHHAMAHLASATHFRRNHPSHHGVP